jgi:perosamine synthetase
MLDTNTKIYLDNANIGELEKKYVLDALESGFISTRGPLIKVFEEKFSSYLGGYVAVTNSGTSALHISILYSLRKKLNNFNHNNFNHKIGAILPAITFAATSHAVLYNRIIPVFVDVDRETWNIDIEKISDYIERCKKRFIDIKFIVPVHLYGNPVDMDKLMTLAKEYNLIVVEDAAEALGSFYKGKKCGTIGDFGTFSFNANKVITASSGGAVFSKSKEDIDYIRFLTLQARNETKGYYHEDMGFNYRMTNISAAILLAQFEKLSYFLDLKKKYFEIYNDFISDLIKFQKVNENSVSNYWLISGLIKDNNITVEKFQEMLGDIPTRRIFFPLPLMDYYKDYVKLYLDGDILNNYKNSFEIYSRGICLPSSTKNSFSAIEYVCHRIRKAFT